MAYITNANFKRIVRAINAKEIALSGNIYTRPIYCFNWLEEQQLLLFKRLLSEPDLIVDEVFTSYNKQDKLEMIHENQPPAYHNDLSCGNLNSDYEDFKIPSEIKKRGKKVIKEFRQWFKDNEHLLEDPAAFSMRMFHRWKIRTNLERVVHGNSGSKEVHNLSLNEVVDTIEDLLRQSAKLYYKSEAHKTIISKLSKYAYLGLSIQPLERNTTGYSEEKVKEILRKYELEIKQPLKALLKQYYMMSLNEDLSFNHKILDQIGFKPCSKCCSKANESGMMRA